MGEWTAIMLAGRRPGENGFAAAHGVAAKALIRAGGEPMLGRVARTLLDSPSIGRIVVLAQEAETLLTGELEWMAAEPRIATARSGDGISASVGRLAGTEAAPYPVLVTTADHALLQPEMVEILHRRRRRGRRGFRNGRAQDRRAGPSRHEADLAQGRERPFQRGQSVRPDDPANRRWGPTSGPGPRRTASAP